MNRVYILYCSIGLLMACGRDAFRTNQKQPIAVNVEVVNVSTQMTSHVWVDAGQGEIDFRYVVVGPRSGKEYGDFPAALGAPINVRWQFSEDGNVQIATNVLGRGLSPGESVRLTLDATSAKATNY